MEPSCALKMHCLAWLLGYQRGWSWTYKRECITCVSITHTTNIKHRTAEVRDTKISNVQNLSPTSTYQTLAVQHCFNWKNDYRCTKFKRLIQAFMQTATANAWCTWALKTDADYDHLILKPKDVTNCTQEEILEHAATPRSNVLIRPGYTSHLFQHLGGLSWQSWHTIWE